MVSQSEYFLERTLNDMRDFSPIAIIEFDDENAADNADSILESLQHSYSCSNGKLNYELSSEEQLTALDKNKIPYRVVERFTQFN